MAVTNQIDVTGAPSVEAVASEIAAGLGGEARNWGTHEHPSWHIASSDWLVSVRFDGDPERSQEAIVVTVYHHGPATAPLHRRA